MTGKAEAGLALAVYVYVCDVYVRLCVRVCVFKQVKLSMQHGTHAEVGGQRVLFFTLPLPPG